MWTGWHDGILCVALFVLLFVNYGLAAQVYDHQTLLHQIIYGGSLCSKSMG